MYKVTLDNRPLFSTDEQGRYNTIIDPKVSLEVGKAGSFTFDIPPDNLEYNNLKPMVSIIRVLQNENVLFTGRILDYSEDFYGIRSVTCEGILSIFNDSVHPPFIYQGNIEGYVKKLVDYYNAQIGGKKTVQIGNITVKDNNNYIRREITTHKTVMELLNDMANTLGGYLILKDAPNNADPYILDYLEEFPANTVDKIEFGENLLDVTKELVSDELLTGIYPLGAEVEIEPPEGETNTTIRRERVTIKTVNDGSDILWANDQLVSEYGRIVAIKEYKDVTRPENLKAKAQKDLNALSKGSTSITVKAVDLEALTGSIDFVVGRNVTVNSAKHGIENEKMLIKKQTIELLNPESSTYEVGTKKLGFIESSVNKGNEYLEIVKDINANYATNKDVSDTRLDIETAKLELNSRIDQTAEDINISVSKTYQTKEDSKTQSASLQLTINGLKTQIESLDGKLTIFDMTEEGLIIGKSDSPIKSIQDNKSYRFEDDKGTILLELNTKGVFTPAVNVTKQLKLGDKWAIRHGAYTAKGYNLDDVWLG